MALRPITAAAPSADDVVVHEWTHAYTQETSGLIYSYQSGALNESYSDVFGETVDQINNREADRRPRRTGNDGPRSEDDTQCAEFMSDVAYRRRLRSAG